ncbi:unnamed protein product, partial [Hermetia illucens]
MAGITTSVTDLLSRMLSAGQVEPLHISQDFASMGLKTLARFDVKIS